MLKKFRDQWLKDLRSGEFKQTRGALCRKVNDSKFYCCMGVLGTQVGEFQSQSDIAGRCALTTEKGLNLTGAIDYTTLNKYGLKHSEQSSLIGLNDTHKKSFGEIADYIEQYIPEDKEDAELQ